MSDCLSAGGSVCVGAAFCQNEPNGDNATISMKVTVAAASPGPRVISRGARFGRTKPKISMISY
jgi:hypothetical protein